MKTIHNLKCILQLNLESLTRRYNLTELMKNIPLNDFGCKIIKTLLLSTCKGHDTVVSLSAGDDTRPAEV